MKVVFISLFRIGFGGGEGRAAYELARHFAGQHDVVLICPGERTTLYRDERGLRVLGIKSAGDGNVCVPILSQKNVNRILEFLDDFGPHIVHAHEPVSLALVGQIWAKMRGVPFVHTAHVLPSRVLDFGAVDVLKVIKGPLTESVTRQYLDNFYQGCDAVVALNDFAAADIRRFGYDGHVLMIPNGRDLAKYSVCRNADPTSSEKVLTFVGFVNPRKNQLYLLQALKYLPTTYRLQIVGGFLNPTYGRELQDFARVHGLCNAVFTGQVEHEQIPTYLEQTHVLVSASKMEVQSLVVLEALASGTPVVGLSNETIDELVDEQVGCKLSKDSPPGEFARCVQAICEQSPSAYARMCQNARQRVERFDWANVVRLTVSNYESLIAAKPSVSQESRIHILDIIELIPSEDVRRALAERVIALDRTVRSHHDSRWDLIKEAKRVSKPTWFFVVLTLLFSLLGYLFLKPRLFSSKRQPDVVEPRYDVAGASHQLGGLLSWRSLLSGPREVCARFGKVLRKE
jgi:glycosyltransferase involved in cell wall biosynthesis